MKIGIFVLGVPLLGITMFVVALFAALNAPSECDPDTDANQNPRRCLSRKECLAKGGYFVDFKFQQNSCYIYYDWKQWKW
jgi:hypothetical protein